jgi:predicted transcriptional regulator
MTPQIGLAATQILEAIHRKARSTPTMIAEELKLTPQTVRNVLVTLLELELVQTPARGLYEITPYGKELLERKKKKVLD